MFELFQSVFFFGLIFAGFFIFQIIKTVPFTIKLILIVASLCLVAFVVKKLFFNDSNAIRNNTGNNP